jgi:hypothetical protein
MLGIFRRRVFPFGLKLRWSLFWLTSKWGIFLLFSEKCELFKKYRAYNPCLISKSGFKSLVKLALVVKALLIWISRLNIYLTYALPPLGRQLSKCSQ